MKKIILAGYMGGGKSAVAKALSTLIHLESLDLDHLIENQEGISITNIFRDKGELYFRKKEHLLLKEILDTDRTFILSLGGGTPCYYNNIELINTQDALTIYLKTSPDVLIQRIKSDVLNRRPLLENVDNFDLNEYVAKHLFERSFYYNQMQHTIITDTLNPDEIASRIASLI